MFSPTYISALIAVLAQILPLIGIEVGSEQLMDAITTILTIVAGLVIMYRRIAKGDVTLFGQLRARTTRSSGLHGRLFDEHRNLDVAGLICLVSELFEAEIDPVRPDQQEDADREIQEQP